jgi:quercetin dioxygenase-like cupin family protein
MRAARLFLVVVFVLATGTVAGSLTGQSVEPRKPVVSTIQAAPLDNVGNRLLLPRTATEKIEMGLVTLKKGEKNRLQSHPNEEEGYLFLEGAGTLLLGDAKHPVAAGSVIYVPRNTAHQVECTSGDGLKYVYFACWP